jgi:response regulator RpfG family c-di-GMP phosphodiesterase
VILISAFATLETAIEALREGASDLIPKPLRDLDVVVRAVERALEKRRESPRGDVSGQRREQQRCEQMLLACTRLTERTTGAAPAEFLAECAATAGVTLGAHAVEIDLGLNGAGLPLRTLWPDAAAGARAPASRREAMTHPIVVAGRNLGALRIIGASQPTTKAQLDFLDAVASLAAVAVERAEAREERDASFIRFLEYLVSMRETTAGFEEGHTRRVAALATRLGHVLGFTERGLGLLRRAAAFHDLGKLGVDPELLNRPGPLSPSELAAVRRHNEVAERLLGATSCLEDVRHILRHLTAPAPASTRTSGSAQPAPIESRILLAAEAFVAMTSARPHRPALDREQALAEMQRETGTRFDAEVVQALESLLESEDGQP